MYSQPKEKMTTKQMITKHAWIIFPIITLTALGITMRAAHVSDDKGLECVSELMNKHNVDWYYAEKFCAEFVK